MKLKIDFDNKLITLEDKTNLGRFFETIEKISPDWKDYNVEAVKEIIWNYPYNERIIVRPYRSIYDSIPDWTVRPSITYDNDNTSNLSGSVCLNIE